MNDKQPYWEMRELVVIGVFAAVTKVSSILVALVGGGMNPLTLILKNLLFTTLAMVLLYKVRKMGALTLFLLVNAMVSMLLMGGGLFLIPPMILAGLVAEGVIMVLGGYGRSINLMIGVGLYDLLFKAGSVGISFLYMREQQEMVVMSAIIVGIGYIGALLGLVTGALFVKELRHACIIRS
ncbi:MAG: MptD family putative ECF transporter S component [Desulfobacterales bacterium]|nr:MptD family putative ECF transporter S component [Desulfobacterales bacterium]